MPRPLHLLRGVLAGRDRLTLLVAVLDRVGGGVGGVVVAFELQRVAHRAPRVQQPAVRIPDEDDDMRGFAGLEDLARLEVRRDVA